MKRHEFSILMAVYIKDCPEFIHEALTSISESTILPVELVLVEDGPVTQGVHDVIDKFRHALNIISVRLVENAGLGHALNAGMKYCTCRLVARCDSDDINRIYRFERQLAEFELDSSLKILSGWVEEFSQRPLDRNIIRKVPGGCIVVEYAKRRNPFNHPCVMFDKNAVLDCGGYQDNYLYEDYALWVRMLNSGMKGGNLQEVLVDMRAANDMFARRGGIGYAKSEMLEQWNFYKIGFINVYELLRNLVLRIPVRMFPNSLRVWVYRNMLRK